MMGFRVRMLGFCLASGLAVWACNKAEGKKPMVTPSTDQEMLARFIRLPRRPTAVQWQTIDRPGTGEWTLAALLTFAPADLRDLVASTPEVNGASRIPSRFLSWFPPSLQEKFRSIPDEPSGFIPVEEARGLSPEPFLGAGTSPLSLGRVLVLEGENLVFLLLSTH
jgi:hypothetical protein